MHNIREIAQAAQDLTAHLPFRLAKKRVADKKLAITVFSFPPDKGNVGTAAYLNVFGSIFRVLQDLQQQGYHTGQLPADERALIELVRPSFPELRPRTCCCHTMHPSGVTAAAAGSALPADSSRRSAAHSRQQRGDNAAASWSNQGTDAAHPMRL